MNGNPVYLEQYIHIDKDCCPHVVSERETPLEWRFAQLNDRLKEMYLDLEKERNNPVIKAALANAFELEKTLKKVRDEYNMAVEKYNMNLIMHKFVCMRIIRMKPLDIYGKISHLEVR